MESLITPELIQELKEFLIEHPPDPAYDEEAEYLDSATAGYTWGWERVTRSTVPVTR